MKILNCHCFKHCLNCSSYEHEAMLYRGTFETKVIYKLFVSFTALNVY